MKSGDKVIWVKKTRDGIFNSETRIPAVIHRKHGDRYTIFIEDPIGTSKRLVMACDVIPGNLSHPISTGVRSRRAGPRP